VYRSLRGSQRVKLDVLVLLKCSINRNTEIHVATYRLDLLSGPILNPEVQTQLSTPGQTKPLPQMIRPESADAKYLLLAR